MRTIGGGAWKHIQVYFSSPTAYIVGLIFLALSGYFFARDVGDPLPEASLNDFFQGATIILMLLAPTLAVRLLADEQKWGTIGSPLTSAGNWELLASKYLAGMVIIVATLAITLYYTILLFVYGSPDPGLIYGGYTGLILYGGAALAVGVLCSTLTSNRFVAEALALALLLLLWFADIIAGSLGGTAFTVIEGFSIKSHFNDFSRGLIDSKHIVYYLSLIVFALLLSVRPWNRVRGVAAAITVVALTGIIVGINFATFEYDGKVDVTATNQAGLHHTTKELLRDLKEPVQATAFYLEDVKYKKYEAADQEKSSRRFMVNKTFEDFEDIRSSKFRFRFVDPELEPETAHQYFGALPPAFVNGSIVIEGLDSGLTQVIKPLNVGHFRLEQDLTSSILEVSGQEQKTIYFLTGHGERDIRTADVDQNTDSEGYDSIRLGLEGNNYDVRTLSWDRLDEGVSVPDGPPEGCPVDDEECLPGAALLVIAGPAEDFPLPHSQALDLYLRGKKVDEQGVVVDRRESARLILLVEPDAPSSFLNFLFVWGVTVRPGYIRDLQSSVSSLPRTLELQIVGPMDVPEDIRQSIDPDTLDVLMGIISPRGESLGLTRMPDATPISIRSVPNRVFAPIAVTSRNSYLIDDLERTEPVMGGEGSDPRGPFSPVWYVEAVGPVGAPALTSLPGRNEIASMVVFGDSDFIANVNIDAGSGADFFLNSVNYLLNDYTLVSIRPNTVEFRELQLSSSAYDFVRFSSWLLMPVLLALMAGFAWRVRR